MFYKWKLWEIQELLFIDKKKIFNNMTTNYIDFKGKKYVLNEPTVSNWAEIMKMKDLLTEQEMYVKMISKVSGQI